jgi:hypothetical protein
MTTAVIGVGNEFRHEDGMGPTLHLAGFTELPWRSCHR